MNTLREHITQIYILPESARETFKAENRARIVKLTKDASVGGLLTLEKFLASDLFEKICSLTPDDVRNSHFWHDYYIAFIMDANASALTGEDKSDNVVAYLQSAWAFRNYASDMIVRSGLTVDDYQLEEFYGDESVCSDFNQLIAVLWEAVGAYAEG